MSGTLIVDDHPIVRQGCRLMLEEAGVKTVLEARNTQSGYRLYLRHRPDVVIVDLALDGDALGGLALISKINARDPQARILVLSMHNDPIVVKRALEAGATGYVLKDTSSADLLAAFEKVRVGSPYLSKDLATQVALSHKRPESSWTELARRERQVVSLLAQGKSYGGIAEELGVSYKTVVNTCSSLRKKLGAQNLQDLVRIAVRIMATSSVAIDRKD
jgi:two-component system, NarL family, invasion response regulator UvrY